MFAAIRQSIELAFKDAWKDTTLIKWQNTKFTPPRDKSFVSLTIIPSDGQCADIGVHGTDRQFGAVFINISTPPGAGPAEVDRLSDLVAAIFRRAQFVKDGVTVRFDAPVPIPQSEGKSSFEGGIKCRYDADKVFTA